MKVSCCECGSLFDPYSKEKKKAGGLFTECPSCATESVRKKTGAMVYSHKTAPEIQIQAPTEEGERLSAYLNKSVQEQRRGTVPVTHGAVERKADVGQSRRGDTTVSVPRFELPEQMISRAGSAPAKEVRTDIVWYDASEKCLFQLTREGKVLKAEVSGLTWRPTHLTADRLSRQKGVLASLLDRISKLITNL